VRRLSRWKAACALIAVTASGADYGDPHWGIQGDVGAGKIPSAIADLADIPLRPDITGLTWNAGVVHFHGSGAPSYSIEYTSLRATVSEAVSFGTFRSNVTGTGTLRGVMVTKYLNFFVRDHFSAGFALGGGYNKLQAGYDLFHDTLLVESRRYNYDVPAFQTLAQADIRPIRWLSVGPFFGMRDGLITGGGALRIHFRR